MTHKRSSIRMMAAVIVISLGLVPFLTTVSNAQEHAAALSPPPVLQKYARVLKGPDPDAVYLQLRAGDPRFVELSKKYEYMAEGEVVVRMESFTTHMSPGDPLLPYKRCRIALPPDADPSTLEVEVIRLVEEEIPKTYQVAPAPPYAPCQKNPPPKEIPLEFEKWGVGKNIVNGKNTLVYEKDALYPAENCRVAYGGRLRKWKAATVIFYPVRYNPAKGKLFLASQIDVKISFRRDPAYLKPPEVKALLRDNVFDDRARDLFLNFDRAKRWYRTPLLKGAKGGGATQPVDPNYAIITTESTFSSSTALDDFCFHKEELGFEVMVVTEHQTRTVEYDPASGYSFAANPGGYEDVAGASPPDQRPDKVRKWLIDNYILLGIEDVLLIGNPDPDNFLEEGDLVGDMPMKDCMLKLLEDIPTDFYFAELTGNWDLDGDGCAGEYLPLAGESNNIPAGVTPNLFCARWEGVLEVTGAAAPVAVGLGVTTEGNTKVWLDADNNGIDDADIIFDDADVHWPASTYHFPALANGVYPVKIEYIQSGGDAYCSVYPYNWTDGVETEFKHDDGTGTYVDHLEADFFNNNDFTGAPVAEWSNGASLYSATGDRGLGGVEFYPEVVVGRIPCYDENQDGTLDYDQLDAILNKIITYENANIHENTWRRRTLTSCPYVAVWDAAANDYTKAKYEWSEMLMDGIAPPPLWEWYRIYEEVYPDVFPAAEVDDGCSQAKTLTAWNDPANPDDGRGVVMWMTHGDQTSARKVFDNTQCGDLDNNKPSIVFMGACSNGKPEFRVDGLGNPVVPLGYANLKNGAIGTISASRTSYG